MKPETTGYTREELVQWLEQQLRPHCIKRLPGAGRRDPLASAAQQLRQVTDSPSPFPQPPLLP